MLIGAHALLHIDSEAYQPDDAAQLLRATNRVLHEVEKGLGVHADRGKAARAVLAVLKTGYGRNGDHRLDADDLAEAAITRYRAAW